MLPIEFQLSAWEHLSYTVAGEGDVGGKAKITVFFSSKEVVQSRGQSLLGCLIGSLQGHGERGD